VENPPHPNPLPQGERERAEFVGLTEQINEVSRTYS
jgi:hypothetical protein